MIEVEALTKVYRVPVKEPGLRGTLRSLYDRRHKDVRAVDGVSFRIEPGESVIGRGQGVAVRLIDDGISRKHARIFQDGEKVVIEDLQSSNGTYVNGRKPWF